MYVAEELARRHRREWEGSGVLTQQEQNDLLQMFHLEFVAAKSNVGELGQQEFTAAYTAIFNPNEPPSVRAAAVASDVKGSCTGMPVSPQVEQALHCPKCYATHLSANKAGYSLGKAVVGGALLGGVGLLGGFVGSRKVQVTCLSCGFSWEAGHRSGGG